MSLEQALTARALIARLGEKSRMNWWDSDAESRAGGILLGRLFPQTASWVAVQLAMQAAAHAHARDLPPIPVVTLFDLGQTANKTIEDLVLQKKTAAAPTAEFEQELVGDDIGKALVSTGLTTHRDLQTVRGRSKSDDRERVVHVGDLPKGADPTGQEVLSLLLAGYQFSSRGRLLVPYLRLV